MSKIKERSKKIPEFLIKRHFLAEMINQSNPKVIVAWGLSNYF